MTKGKDMLRIENEKKKKKKEKKKIGCNLVRTADAAWESSVTTTAPANYVFKIESCFYIITYSS